MKRKRKIRIKEEYIKWYTLYSVQIRFLWLWWTIECFTQRYQAEEYIKEKGA